MRHQIAWRDFIRALWLEPIGELEPRNSMEAGVSHSTVSSEKGRKTPIVSSRLDVPRWTRLLSRIVSKDDAVNLGSVCPISHGITNEVMVD